MRQFHDIRQLREVERVVWKIFEMLYELIELLRQHCVAAVAVPDLKTKVSQCVWSSISTSKAALQMQTQLHLLG